MDAIPVQYIISNDFVSYKLICCHLIVWDPSTCKWSCNSVDIGIYSGNYNNFKFFTSTLLKYNQDKVDRYINIRFIRAHTHKHLHISNILELHSKLTFVLSLEFSSKIWNPTKKRLIDKLDTIHRWFTKRIHSISHLSYLKRLFAFKLGLGRFQFDLIQYYVQFSSILLHLNFTHISNFIVRHLRHAIHLLSTRNYLTSSIFILLQMFRLLECIARGCQTVLFTHDLFLTSNQGVWFQQILEGQRF